MYQGYIGIDVMPQETQELRDVLDFAKMSRRAVPFVIRASRPVSQNRKSDLGDKEGEAEHNV